MAPEEGLEPSTTRLTAACSTIELLWNPIRKGAHSTNPRPHRQFIFLENSVLITRSQTLSREVDEPILCGLPPRLAQIQIGRVL